jgi:GNAT superfamily N-acetyltransferase
VTATASHEPTRRELLDGSVIELREVRASDKDAIATGFNKLSPESRYRRFFSSRNRLSASDLRYLTEVDHRDHEAVIASDREGRPVGVARYVRGEDEGSAEVAVAVVDEWQGRGAGTALLERLTERASENGVERFVALVLEENAEAIDLFRSISDETSRPRRTPEGYLELILDVPTGEVHGTALGRALRSAASGNVVIHPWRLIKERLQGVKRPSSASAAIPEDPHEGAEGE